MSTNPERIRSILKRNRYFVSVFFTSFVLFVSLSSALFFSMYALYRWDMDKKEARSFAEARENAATHARVMDTKITTIANQIAADQRLRRWILGVPGYDSYLSLQQLLNSFFSVSSSDEDVASIDVYNGRQGAILSTYYGFRKKEREPAFTRIRDGLFGSLLSGGEASRFVQTPPELSNEPCLTYLLLVPPENRIGALALSFKLARFLPNQNKEKTVWALIDSKGVPVRADSPETAAELLRAAKGRSVGMVDIDGAAYRYAVDRVFAGSYSLLFAVRAESYGIRGPFLSTYLPPLLIVSFSISLLASLFLGRRVRKPIFDIVATARRELHLPDAVPGSPAGDTLGVLRDTFNTMIRQNESTERIIKENKEFLLENALRNLFFGNDPDGVRSFYEETFQRPGGNCFLVAIFGFEDLKQPEPTAAETGILQPILAGFTGGLLRTGFRTWTLLLNLEKAEDKQIVEGRVAAMQKTASDAHGISLSVGLSSVVLEVPEIRRAYEEAAEALRYRSFYGRGSLIDAEKLDPCRNSVHLFSIKDGQTLIDRLRTLNESQMDEYVRAMIKEKEAEYTPELMNAFFLYLYSCVGKVAREFGLRDESFYAVTVFSLVDDSQTIEEKTQSLIDRCVAILSHRTHEQRRFKSLSVEIVLNYIRENYQKPISLSIIASDLKVSVSYLSELLKKELGMTYVCYINALRMEKSLELLRDGSLTIKKISVLLGYDSEHSFIRNFKRRFGRTPSDYRNRASEPLIGDIVH